MSRISTYLFDTLQQARGIHILRKALYVFLLYKVLLYLLWFPTWFGPEAAIYVKPGTVHGIRDLAFLLNLYDLVWLRKLFIGITAVIALVGLFGYQSIVSNMVLSFCTYNLHNYLYPTLTAGDFLLNQLLFFNIFFITRTSAKPVLHDLQCAIHNTALLALKIQICLVYVLAAYYKLLDSTWLGGEAVHRSLLIDCYSLPCLKNLPHGIYLFMNYFTLLYQLLFPVLVWFRPTKRWLLVMGVLQHLFIAVGMGLFSFGMVMIISYIIFIDWDKNRRFAPYVYN
jgi:hypothetical protein